MKKLLIFPLVFLTLFSNIFAQQERIDWQKDFKAAQALARQTGRPMLLDFTAEWCKPCREMDANYWVLPAVVQTMKSFVAVKVNYDKDQTLVDRYSATGLPFIVITDPLGNKVTVKRGFGLRSPDEMNQIFAAVPRDFSPLKKDFDLLERNKDDADALVHIADFYTDSKLNLLGASFYKRALLTDRLKTDAERREAVSYKLGSNYYDAGAYIAAVETLDEHLKNFPAAKQRETTLSMLTVANAKLGKSAEAAARLETLKKEFPASINIQAAAIAVEKAKNKSTKK